MLMSSNIFRVTDTIFGTLISLKSAFGNGSRVSG
jgi:hypothetical protein